MVRRLAGRVAATALALTLAASAYGHELRHEISEGPAVVARFSFADDNPFSFQSYEIRRAGESTPYQLGHTDAQGRVVFVPDRPGEWRLRLHSEDGHGEKVRLTTGEQGVVAAADRAFFDRHARMLTGAGLIFGLFGVLSLLYQGKKS